jgi:hypothetical protein
MRCAHCESRIQSDRFLELQPCTTSSTDELVRENIAWFVHTECAPGLIEARFE